MIEINIDTNKLWKSLYDADIRGALNRGIKKGTITLEREAKIETPVDTGILRNSFITEIEELQGKVINTREYGLYVHEGTGIYARNGNGRKTPRFYTDSQWNGRITRWQKPNPFFDRAMDNSSDKIDMIFSKEIDVLLANI